MEKIELKEAVSMDGKGHDFTGLPFDLQKDLLCSSKPFDWGDSEARCILIALPSSRRFKSFCYSHSPLQCLRFLEEFSNSTPLILKYQLASFLEKYPANFFADYYSKDVVVRVAKLLTKVQDPDLNLLFLKTYYQPHAKNFS